MYHDVITLLKSAMTWEANKPKDERDQAAITLLSGYYAVQATARKPAVAGPDQKAAEWQALAAICLVLEYFVYKYKTTDEKDRPGLYVQLERFIAALNASAAKAASAYGADYYQTYEKEMNKLSAQCPPIPATPGTDTPPDRSDLLPKDSCWKLVKMCRTWPVLGYKMYDTSNRWPNLIEYALVRVPRPGCKDTLVPPLDGFLVGLDYTDSSLSNCTSSR